MLVQHCPTLLNAKYWANIVQHCWMKPVGQSLFNRFGCNVLDSHCPTLPDVTGWANVVQHCWMLHVGPILCNTAGCNVLGKRWPTLLDVTCWANIVVLFWVQPVDSPCPTLLYAKCWANIVQHCSVWHVRSSSKPFWAVLKIGASLKPGYSRKPCKWPLKMLRRNSGVQNWTKEGLFVVEVPTRLPFGRELNARYDGRSFVLSL